MTSLLELLTTREGTAKAVRLALEAGGDSKEISQYSKESALHILFRRCVLPLELYDTVKVLVEYGTHVNHHDHNGSNALCLLVLHINHGLRYHSYPLPEVQRLEDLAAPKHDIQKLMVDLDAKYQEQVFQSLELLLQNGADANDVPDIVPAIPASTEWVDAYEHKLMQQEGRWHLLGHDTSMELSRYNIFNPMSSHRCLNDQKLTPLHLAAWRGDARCIRLLLRHGADATAVTEVTKPGKQDRIRQLSNPRFRKPHHWSKMGKLLYDNAGRGILHLLYFYCNKPRDLVEATQVLLTAGADANVCREGEYPAHYLIPHVMVKRSYHQYLSNMYLTEELHPVSDNYIPEVSACLQLLAEAGMTDRTVWDSLFVQLFDHFRDILYNTDKLFQLSSHYLVPYAFCIEALTQFTAFLITQGCEVNAPLRHLAISISNLSTDPALNSSSAICRCFRTLLDAGANCNTKDENDSFTGSAIFSVVRHTQQAISTSDNHGVDTFSDLLDLMMSQGGGFNILDCLSKELYVYPQVTLKRLLNVLLLSGADANNAWCMEEDADSPVTCGHTTYALDTLLSLHFGPERDYYTDDNPVRLLPGILPMVSGCMHQKPIHQVVSRFLENMCPRLEEINDTFVWNSHKPYKLWHCDECFLVFRHSREPFKLKLSCRQVLSKAMKGCYRKGVSNLPLPPVIKQYLLDLNTVV